ncbi:MAG: hypothetical protein JXB35_12185, partial [Anaerolineae bacterium]|nr:hypothetical protein [Anaerolineae bacterium]
MLPRRLWYGFLVFALLSAWVCPVAAQDVDEDPIAQLVQSLPTRVKVGQLVMVTFPGTDVSAAAEITALIQDAHIGGVWLRPEHGNFGAPALSPADVISLTNQLQRLTGVPAYPAVGPQPEIATFGGTSFPLFVAVDPYIDGLPVTAFVSDTTRIPLPMALGATWNRALAEAAGQVVGQELSGLGINFLLGPSLDVLDTPQMGDPSAIGTTAFGGHPYWVGEMGKAFVRGVHQGSDDRMAVIPRNFPGLGSADRPVETETPTVQKTLEQLQETELAAFAAVAHSAPGIESVADGMLVTHVRYQGFQGNITQSTRPISLDGPALSLALSGMEAWRTAGGILVADSLGMRSLRRFNDPREATFNARQVARDALLAGNDLLILDTFSVDEAWDGHFANIRDTLDFLAQLYESDSTVQARVDEALYRVLSLKLRIAPRLSLDDVARSAAPEVLAEIFGRGGGVNAQVASSALTRLAPAADDLLTTPPQEGARVVVFAQESDVTFNGGAASRPILTADTIVQTLLRLYGPQGTGQVRTSNVQSFSFSELRTAVENPSPLIEDLAFPIVNSLQRAQWLILATTGNGSDSESVVVLQAFLGELADLVDARIVVLNFGPPYALDSTHVSKIDQYYALYCPGEAFVQAGIQALFRDLPAVGASPVSIPALNYVLASQLEPDPGQIIGLTVIDGSGQEMASEEIQDIRKDDVLQLRTTVIKDRNGHPVPNGTPVQFTLAYPQEDRRDYIATTTKDGVAFTSVNLDRVGQLDITVESAPAPPLFHLQLTIREESVIMISITPTPEPQEPTPTPTPIPEIPAAKALPEPLRLPAPHGPGLLLWGVSGGIVSAFLGFLWARERLRGLARAVQFALWGAIGGL